MQTLNLPDRNRDEFENLMSRPCIGLSLSDSMLNVLTDEPFRPSIAISNSSRGLQGHRLAELCTAYKESLHHFNA